ncbi:MAG: hypothetical protein Q4D16_25360 [Eubacteriales bacterium]|nr:hypothetical protein [Eubacteriales bacterium]
MKNYQFNIAVCDDEQADKEEIAKMTEEICNEEQISSVITCFGSAKKASGRDKERTAV